MGFWSAIGGALKAVGGLLFGGTGRVIGWLAEKIFNLGDTPSYNSSTATVDETKKVNELLEKCIQGYSKEAEEYDKLAQNIIKANFQTIEEKLSEINKVSDKPIIDNFVFESFKNNTKNINKSLDKIYSKQISNTFSLNNNKLLDILKLDKGNNKNDKLRDLAINTVTKANNTLLCELSDFTKEQQNFISSKLSEYMTNRKNTLMTSKNETEKILASLEKDDNERTQLKNYYSNLLNEINLLGNILNLGGK
jgi:hypothetical protein